MPKSDSLIHTKLRIPSARPSLVARTRLQQQVVQGLRCPLTLLIAPAGFGKTTLLAACLSGCGMPVAWLSLDKNDNQAVHFLTYVVAALHQADERIGNEAARLMTGSQQVQSDAVLTSLINDLDSASGGIALVLDDYHFISSQAVHEEMTFLLDHCPNTLHIVIASRSDPPLPIARVRARGQLLELRAADLRFIETEAAQFLNDVMGLHLDVGSVAVLEERTEGWIAGLQMAALSMRDRGDVPGFIKGFSGTNRYILDYLLEEVLASQSPEIQHFLLPTSILERLTAPLCDAVLAVDREWKSEGYDPATHSLSMSLNGSAPILEYLDRANLFLVPLDNERQWYRYHHLFADLLRAQLQKSLGEQGVARLHLGASEWYRRNGLTLDAIYHASLASDFESIEHLIEQNYIEMFNRGEMSGILRFWMGKLSKEQVFRRPWLCLYEAFSHSWFGQLEEANLLLSEAEKRIRSEITNPDTQAMLGYHAYIQSRVTAMQGDTARAIELCLTARENVPADNLGLQIEIGITLGFEYFLYGNFVNANKTLYDMIRLCQTVRAINNPVAAYALLSRLQMIKGQLHEADELLEKASRLIKEPGNEYLGAVGLIEVGKAALLCEWNDLEAALVRVKKGLDLLPMWGKADDLSLAYTTLARIQLALGNGSEAWGTIEKAAQLVQTCGVFSEARSAVETAHVKMWLLQKDCSAMDNWVSTLDNRLDSHEPFRFEDELTHITRARVYIAQKKFEEAISLLTCLEESARLSGRIGRLIEIMILKALALQAIGNNAQAESTLTQSLTLAEHGGYVRVFLDEARPMQLLLAQWLAHPNSSALRDYTIHLLSQFGARPHSGLAAQESVSATDNTVEPLSTRELEVLHLMALGRTNREIAEQLVIALGTVKAHTASIYHKLNVANRTEAVACARQLGILP